MSETEIDAEMGAESKKGREERGYDTIALRELRRARKLMKDGEVSPEANVAIATANVLALLDLAAAIRGHNGP